MSEESAGVVVLDHHHDAKNKIYRLTLGHPIEVQREQTDEDGNPAPSRQPLIGPGGEVMKDFDGKEIYLPGPPELETVIEHVPGEDFVFADDDDRYEGKTPEEIAQMHRADVKKELARREREAKKNEATVSKRKQLPGTGEAL